ncbi:hypothetical protein [Spirosoma fluminis]
MRRFIPDSVDLGGTPSPQRSSREVPSVLENDPHADEEIINQQAGEQYPKAVEEPAAEAKIAPDDLADSIAYAIDGSGPGPTNDRPNVSGHKTITEGITGASLDEEEDALRA